MLLCPLEEIYQHCKSSIIVTIGNFDGVHLGHLHLLSILRQQAKIHQASSVVITFEPHPKSILSPEKTHCRLTLSEEKRFLIEKTGVDCYVEIPFTLAFSTIEYDQFLQKILSQSVNFKTLCLGKDHKFGKKGLGTVNKVRDLLQQHRVEVIEVDDLMVDNKKITSTTIRQLILQGQIQEANQWLSKDYSFEGKVVIGEKIGKTIGFPTANITLAPEKIVPKNGVYAVRVVLDNHSFRGMMNIGQRPTITTKKTTTIEVHIFDFDKNIYDRQLQIFPLQFIRHERKMSSVNELREQLEKDQLRVLSIDNF